MTWPDLPLGFPTLLSPCLLRLKGGARWHNNTQDKALPFQHPDARVLESKGGHVSQQKKLQSHFSHQMATHNMVLVSEHG